jgi:hypothetical protein
MFEIVPSDIGETAKRLIMTAKAKEIGAFLVSRAGIAALRDAGYYAIGAGLLVAGIVGLRDFAQEGSFIAALVHSSPLIATAAGAVWAMAKA